VSKKFCFQTSHEASQWWQWPRHTAWAAAVCVWHQRNTAGLAPVIPQGPDSVRQAGSASVTSCEARGRCSAGVCPRASVVWRLLQPGGWHHHIPLPLVRRWHAAPPRHVCWQHSCKTRCSCRVYSRRQTVVPTERPAAQPGQVGGSSCPHCESAVWWNVGL